MESDEMRWSMDNSSSLGMPMSPQEISKRYKHQILGMAPRHPFFIGKNQVTFQHTIFLLFHILCVFLRASLLLLSVLFCFVCWNKWLDPNKFLLEETHSVFHLPRTLYFLLLSFNECSFFLELRLAFIFHLDFCSDLVISLHQGVFRPLVYVGFHQKSCLKKVWMVLEKRKKFHAKSGIKGSLFRLRLRLLHAMLDVVLIVCLVFFAVAWLVSNDWDCLMCLWKNHALFLLYGSILLWFSPWCFIWVDLAHA
jgi:hypothetical protein